MSAGLVYFQGKMRTFGEAQPIEKGRDAGRVRVWLREIVQRGKGAGRAWSWTVRARVVEPSAIIRLPGGEEEKK